MKKIAKQSTAALHPFCPAISQCCPPFSSGLLDSVESPDSDGHYSSLRWNSEAELTSNLHGPATEEIFPPYQPKKATRKLSPPLAMAARLLSESRMRSGSDPALIKKAADENRYNKERSAHVAERDSTCVTHFSRKPFMATLKSGMRSKSGNPGGSAQDVGRSSPSSSPKIGESRTHLSFCFVNVSLPLRSHST